MSIPLSQLETWSKQGPIISSSSTYQSIKNALEHNNSPVSELINSGKIKVYLQGSYANDTNIRGDSDVDVVVELTGVFHSNKYELTPTELQLHEQTYEKATYGLEKLRNDVVKALQLYFDETFVDISGNKSIKILPNGIRLRADVVPVVSYRKYTYFNGDNDHEKKEGVVLTHRTTNEKIVNYPNTHYENGVLKHGDTNKLFKPTVRIFKNAVSYLVDNGSLQKGVAPSYFLQSMIYNVPAHLFESDLGVTFCNVVNHLNSTNLSTFTCQHGIHGLFGSDDTYWNEVDARKTLIALINLWNEWYA